MKKVTKTSDAANAVTDIENDLGIDFSQTKTCSMSDIIDRMKDDMMEQSNIDGCFEARDKAVAAHYRKTGIVEAQMEHEGFEYRFALDFNHKEYSLVVYTPQFTDSRITVQMLQYIIEVITEDEITVNNGYVSLSFWELTNISIMSDSTFDEE